METTDTKLVPESKVGKITEAEKKIDEIRRKVSENKKKIKEKENKNKTSEEQQSGGTNDTFNIPVNRENFFEVFVFSKEQEVELRMSTEDFEMVMKKCGIDPITLKTSSVPMLASEIQRMSDYIGMGIRIEHITALTAVPTIKFVN